jgi:hypothetical protein
LAEAELDAARMDVSRKIIDLWAERQTEQANKTIVQRAQSNAVTVDLIDIQMKLSRIDTELRYL